MANQECVDYFMTTREVAQEEAGAGGPCVSCSFDVTRIGGKAVLIMFVAFCTNVAFWCIPVAPRGPMGTHGDSKEGPWRPCGTPCPPWPPQVDPRDPWVLRGPFAIDILLHLVQEQGQPSSREGPQ